MVDDERRPLYRETNGEPGVGEAHRRLNRLEQRLDERVVSLNTYLAERAHDRDEVEALRENLKAVSERLTWAWRIALTGVLLPVAVTIFGSVALVLLLGDT